MTDQSNLSPLIRWCGRLALAFLALIPLSVLGVKFGILHFAAGLGVFAISCLLSLIILIILAICSLLPKFREQRSAVLLRSLAALPGVLLAGALLGSGGDYPPIHDITTDTDDPPVFIQGIIERGPDSNPITIKPDYIAAQLEAYPDLATIKTDLEMEAAMDKAAQAAEALNWVIYNRDDEAGVIEASYTSFWFGFVDDIVIRFSPAVGGAEVDLRSVSRVGRGDLGANANRIRAFTRVYESL